MEERIEYYVVRSARKTLAVEIRPDGRVIVRAPQRMAKRAIEGFLCQKADWIRQTRAKVIAKAGPEAVQKLSPQELKALADKAVKYIPERVRYYAPLVGVDYGRITIRSQKTRWGSCSAQGNLNFNCLLMLAPPEVLDSVVVHELCHRKEMNHSKRFYAEVYRVFPQYDEVHKWLKENGSKLLMKL